MCELQGETKKKMVKKVDVDVAISLFMLSSIIVSIVKILFW